MIIIIVIVVIIIVIIIIIVVIVIIIIIIVIIIIVIIIAIIIIIIVIIIIVIIIVIIITIIIIVIIIVIVIIMIDVIIIVIIVIIVIVIITLTFSLSFLLVQGKNVCDTKACHKIAAEIRSNIDASIDPCEDFDKFACGGWRKQNPIPKANAEWTKFLKLWESEERILKNEIERQAKSPGMIYLTNNYSRAVGGGGRGFFTRCDVFSV